MARPARIRLGLLDSPAGATPIALVGGRSRVAGAVFGVAFLVFASIAVLQVRSMIGGPVDTVSDLSSFLFRAFWVLGWSVGVVVLFAFTVMFLLYGESAYLTGTRLVYVPRLGPVRVFLEYDLSRVTNVRVEAGTRDRSRICFSYGGATAMLGNGVGPSAAEHDAQLIRDAAHRARTSTPVPADATGKEPAESESAVPTAPVEPVAWTATSVLTLMVANLIPLAGVLFLGWDLGQIMVLFWAENAVIGFFTLIKLVMMARWMSLVVGPFFVAHYGGFMAGHFIFVYFLFVRGIDATGSEPAVLPALKALFIPLWPALAALFVSHGVSFFTNYIGRGEYKRHDLQSVMTAPYKRIVLLHVTLIVGGWLIMALGTPLPALVFLVVLKTVTDLRAHRREHAARPG